MPYLSIIPAAAVADQSLTDGQVRVLCAIGTHTNKLGGNVWASVRTLASECNMTERSVQRAVGALVDRGYLRKLERPGRTNMYEVVLERPLTAVSPQGDSAVTPPPTPVSPKRSSKRQNLTDTQRERLDALMRQLWEVFPERDVPHLFIPAREAILGVLLHGATPEQLVRSAQRYAAHCEKEHVEPKYVKSMQRFYADGMWEAFDVVTVHGRTRQEWARSGQDVAEFDRLAAQQSTGGA